MAFPILLTCELCGRDATLQRSHIVPAFVYRRVLGKHTRYIDALHPRRTEQRGESVHMLCRRCEDAFSKSEQYFQRTIWPRKGITSLPIRYESTLYKFACSVSWRVLTYLKLSSLDTHIAHTRISNLLESHISKAEHDICDTVLSGWSEFLMQGKCCESDQHLVFLNGKNVQHERSDIVGFALFRDKENLAVVAILGPLLLLGFITRGSGWRGTRIDPNGSVFQAQPQQVPTPFGNWLRELYSGLEEIAH